MVRRNGLSVRARSGSRWIHWWSSVASAKVAIRSWVISNQSLGSSVVPTRFFNPSTVVVVGMVVTFDAMVLWGVVRSGDGDAAIDGECLSGDVAGGVEFGGIAGAPEHHP